MTAPGKPGMGRKLAAGLDRIFAAIPLMLAGLLLAVIAVHPRNVEAGTGAGPSGKRFLSEDRGYKAAIDRLADLRVFTVRTLPAGRGLPPREAVTFDEAALAAAERQGLLCRPAEPSVFAQIADWFAQLRRGAGKRAASPCRALLDDYRNATFLAQDMLRATPQTWLMKGNVVTGMRPQAHALRESGYDPISAQGIITYASASSAPEDNWALVDPASIDFEMEELQRAPGTAACRIAGADAAIRSYCFREGVVIVLPPELTRQQVYLDGRPVTDPQAPAGKRFRILTLQEGATLAFADPGAKPTQARQLLQRRANLSQVIDGMRIRDPAFAGLASQIDTTLTGQLQSTIDRNLQREIQRVLDDTLQTKPEEQGASLRGAVVLMDGLNGQIAGAATFPNRPEHLLTRDRSRPERVRWLEQNQAFETLPVGSTAKVPFAGAITTAQPDLLKLTVGASHAGKYDAKEFLRSGRFVTGPDSISGPARPGADFNTALVQSDNVYAISLIRRAWLANRAAPQDAAWLHNIRALACAAPPGVTLPDQLCPVFPWGDDSEPQRGGRHGGVIFAFDAAKVEQAPHVELFYGPLGNGSFNWSLVQLTQAYARFMSGRAVAMTLSAGKRTSPPLEDFLKGPGYDRSWDAVMRGMRGVTQSGTAKELKDLEAVLGDGVYLYGKTGTPTLGYRAEADGKLFVLAAIRTTDGRPPEPSDGEAAKTARGRICAIRFLTINLEVDTSAVPVARRLIEKNPAVRRWMTAKCPAVTTGAR